MVDELIVFGGSGSPRLAAGICKYLKIPCGKGEVIKYADGNLFVRVQENVRGRHVYVIQSTAWPAKLVRPSAAASPNRRPQ